MLIGLTGLSGSGKDTVADYLVSNHNFFKLTFAKPIHDLILALLDWEYEYEFLTEIKNEPHPNLFGKTPRELMQFIGTEWGRDMVHPDLWLRRVQTLKKDLTNMTHFVISDVRFENEADWVRSEGTLIHIHRSTIERFPHSSESGVPFKEQDIVIQNDSISIPELHQTVKAALNL